MTADIPDDNALGNRVAILRSQRGMSRRVLANLVGRSEEWLRLIETGRRQLDSLSTVLRMAEILHVTDIAGFIGARPQLRRPEPQVTAQLAALRRALGQVPWMRKQMAPHPDDPDVELAELWERWRSSSTRYSDIAAALPPLLAYYQERSEIDPTSPRWNVALVSCYVLARSILSRTGDHDASRLAADRAMQIASSSPLDWTRPLAAWHMGMALLNLDLLGPALECVDAAAIRIDEHSPQGSDWGWLAGALRLLAAEIAAARYDSLATRQELTSANLITGRMNRDRFELGVWCGPTEFGIVQVRVALQLGDIEQALRHARTLNIPLDYSAERVARHYIALAGAYASRHNDVAAVYALTRVEQVSPEDIYFDANAHRTLKWLADRNDLTIRSDLERLLALVPVENLKGLTAHRFTNQGEDSSRYNLRSCTRKASIRASPARQIPPGNTDQRRRKATRNCSRGCITAVMIRTRPTRTNSARPTSSRPPTPESRRVPPPVRPPRRRS